MKQMLQPVDASPHGEKLTETMARCYRMKILWDCDLMEAVADFDKAQAYADEGFSSTAEWLSATLCMGFNKAWEYVRIAVALAELPKMAAAYREGRVSYDHLRALVDVAGPYNEQDLLLAVEGISVGDTFKLVRTILEVSAEDAVIAREGRSLEMRWDHENRQLLVFAQLPEEMGAKFEAVIDVIAKQIPDEPGEDPTPPMSMGTKRADALVALADSELATHSTRSTIVVHVDAATLQQSKGKALIEGGPHISAETAKRLSCDSLVRAVAENKAGEPLAAGRNRRTVDDKTRSELFYRQGGCVVAGCNRTKGLEVHHIKHWINCRVTEYRNLALLCAFHHFQVHEGGWVLRGEPPRVTVVRPARSPMALGPPRMTEDAIEFYLWEAAVTKGVVPVPDS